MSQNGDSPKVKIVCPACQQHFSASPPDLEISNALYTSVITGAHERLIRCQCGQHFVMMIGQAQVSWFVQPVGSDVVEKVTGSKIIKPNITLLN